MSELTVSTWHRKGHHRLYVSREADGASIGYWDLAANEPHPNHPGDLAILVGRVRQWKAEHPVEAAWWMAPDQDPAAGLAADMAGAAVREHPRDERSPSPIRTLWERMRGTKEPDRNWRTAAG